MKINNTQQNAIVLLYLDMSENVKAILKKKKLINTFKQHAIFPNIALAK